MARKEGDQWVASDGSKWSSQGSAANASNAHRSSSSGSASESLIDGVGSALSGIGDAIQSAIDAKLDKARRKSYLEEQGGAEYEEAQRLESQGAYKQAIKQYDKAAGKGFVDALYRIADCARTGLKSAEYAFTYYQKYDAAQGSNSISEWDKSKVKHLEEATWHHLSECYRNGAGTAKDEAKAFSYARKVADGNCFGVDMAHTAIYAAECYRDGTGVKQNTAAAVGYFTKVKDWADGATYAGNELNNELKVIRAECMYRIAECYREGGPGLAANRDKAIKLFRDAFFAGSKEAKATLAEMGVKVSMAGEVGNRGIAWLYAVPVGFGVALAINWVYVLVTGADKVPVLFSLAAIAICGIGAFMVMRNRSKLAWILVAVAVFGWLYLFDIIPARESKVAAQTEQAAFSSGLTGTWKRDNFDNTLTLTANTLKASNQRETWNVTRVGGDAYSVKSGEVAATLTIKLTDGTMVISGDSGSAEHSWNGIWEKTE